MTMTGPHGTFRILSLLAFHSVERDAAGVTIYRDCLVELSDGSRRVYGVRVDLLGPAL